MPVEWELCFVLALSACECCFGCFCFFGFLTFGAAVVVAACVVGVVVVVTRHASVLSPWLRCAWTAGIATVIVWNGCFFDPVR